MKKTLNPKILQLRKAEKPIEYSSVTVDNNGELQERESLLDKRIVEGYALIWGSVNSHEERFVKGCCAKAIKEIGPGSNSPYQLKFRDEHGRVCGLFETIKEDEIGLYFKTVPLDNVPWANNLLTQLKSRSINNFSIGFNHVWDKVEWDDLLDCLVCLEIRLMEISAVAIPSDSATYAIRSVETMEDVNEDVREFISLLPASKQIVAKKLFTRCFSLSERPAGKPVDKPLVNKKAEKTRNNKLYKSLLKKLDDE